MSDQLLCASATMPNAPGSSASSPAIVSQPTGWDTRPSPVSTRLISPLFVSNMKVRIVPLTTGGSSHGIRISDRRKAFAGKRREKKTASARPMPYWKTREMPTNRRVFRRT